MPGDYQVVMEDSPVADNGESPSVAVGDEDDGTSAIAQIRADLSGGNPQGAVDGARAVVDGIISRRAWAALEEVADLAVDAAQAVGDATTRLDFEQLLAIAKAESGDRDTAEAIFASLERRTHESGDRLRRARALAHLGHISRSRGDRDEANTRLREAVSLYSTLQGEQAQLGLARTLADLANLMDDAPAPNPDALQLYDQAQEIFGRLRAARDSALAQVNAAMLNLRLRRWADALVLLKQSSDTLKDCGDHLGFAQSEWLCAQAYAELGDAIEAQKAAIRALAILREHADPDVGRLETFVHEMDLRAAARRFEAAHDLVTRRALTSSYPELLTGQYLAYLRRRAEEAVDEPTREVFASAATHLQELLVDNRQASSQALGRQLREHFIDLPEALHQAISEALDRELSLGQVDALERTANASADAGNAPLAAALFNLAGEVALKLPPTASTRRLACRLLQESLLLVRETNDTDETIRLHLRIGSLLREDESGDHRQNLEDSLLHARSALKYATRLRSPIDWAKVLNNLGNIYRDLAQYDGPRAMERAAARYRSALSAVNTTVDAGIWAILQSNLGYALTTDLTADEARLREGEQALREVLRQQRYLHPRNVAIAKTNLANALLRAGYRDRAVNADEAIQLHKEAFDYYLSIEDSVAASDSADNLGNAWSRISHSGGADDFESALLWHERALSLLDAVASPNRWAAASDNLACDYAARTRGDETSNLHRAADLHEAALAIYGPNNHPVEWARANHNYAFTLLRLAASERTTSDDQRGYAAAAIALLERALSVRQPDAGLMDWAASQRLLGDAAGMLDGQEDRALSCYEAAAQVPPGIDPAAALESFMRLAHAHAARGAWRPASEAYAVAVEALQRLYDKALLPQSRASELSSAEDLVRQYAYCLAQSGRTGEAVLELERGRTRALNEAAMRRLLTLPQVSGDDPLLESYIKAVSHLRLIESSHDDMTNVSDGPSSLNQRIAALRDAQTAVSVLADQIRSGHKPQAPPGLDDILVATAGTPVAYLIATEWGNLSLLLGHYPGVEDAAVLADFGELRVVDLGRFMARRNGVDAYTGYLPAQFDESSELLKDVLEEDLPQLSPLVEGVMNRLEVSGHRELVLIPTGILSIVPLHAIPHADHGETLLDRFDVSYLPSAAIAMLPYRVARSSTIKREREGDLALIVADPTDDLEYAAAEGEFVRRLNPQGELLLREHATPEAVVAYLPRASIAHFACHGYYNLQNPLDSGLKLNGADLTARDLLARHSTDGLELVVLSACQTGLTDFVRLPDEAIGLGTAILQTGAAVVVSTLWRVNDLSTALLMREFYATMQESSGKRTAPHVALRVAQQWLRQLTWRDLEYEIEDRAITPDEAYAAFVKRRARTVPTEQPFSSPFYWGAFIATGRPPEERG
jgi:CHAT domain-containing protein